MYTFTTDAFLGFRPWQSGEIYLTPEISQGVPFSTDSDWLGRFHQWGNHARSRTASDALPAKAFSASDLEQWRRIRTRVESNLNQLAGFEDKNRFVLTVGNFSTLDVFDPNTYAKDPRTQFMNWGNWTYAAYDYAADARGFGWGFAAEWYQDDWVLRFGRMSGPKRSQWSTR
jgi:high affinity Mn2+ porin